MKQARAKPPIPLCSNVFCREENTRIYWLGGASFLVCAYGESVLIDPQMTVSERNGRLYGANGLPLFAAPPMRAEQAGDVGLVLYTHADDDHFETETAQKLGSLGVHLAGPVPVFEKAVRLGIPEKQLSLIHTGDLLTVGEIRVTVFPADHPWQLLNVKKFGRPYGAGDCAGFLIDTPDVRIFISGDTRLLPEHTELTGVDVLGMDASACCFHLGVQGSAALCRYLSKAWLIPCHYGTYDAPGDPAHGGNPSDVLNLVEGADKRLIDAAPGERIAFRSHRRTV